MKLGNIAVLGFFSYECKVYIRVPPFVHKDWGMYTACSWDDHTPAFPVEEGKEVLDIEVTPLAKTNLEVVSVQLRFLTEQDREKQIEWFKHLFPLVAVFKCQSTIDAFDIRILVMATEKGEIFRALTYYGDRNFRII